MGRLGELPPAPVVATSPAAAVEAFVGAGMPGPYGGIRQIGSQPSTARANNVRPYILYSDS